MDRPTTSVQRTRSPATRCKAGSINPLPAIIAAAALTGGCATYRPLPLGSAEAALARPEASILVRDGAQFGDAARPPVDVRLDRPLDADAVALVAVIANPDLKALRARAGVADAQVFAAGLLPDPTFSMGIDHLVSGPDPVDNLAGALGLDLNALRTRKVSRARASAEARQVRLDLAWSEWQTAGQARIQAVRIAALERAIAVARDADRSAARSLERTMGAVGRGDLAPDQMQAARTGAYDAADRLRTGERDLGAARVEILRLMGLPPDYPLRIAPAPSEEPVPDADALVRLAIARRQDLQALREGYEAQEAAVHKAVLDQFPNLALTINGARDTGRNVLLGPAIDFTLPIWNRNRGGIAIERATRAALKAEYEARLFQTRAEIAAAVNALRIVDAQRAGAARDLPALDVFAIAARRAAARGDLASETANAAEQAARDRRLLWLQSDQDRAEQMIALELLTGAPREAWMR